MRSAVQSLLAITLAAGACARSTGTGGAGPSAATTRVDQGPVRLATVGGFAIPESARWDPEQRVWFVSNINVGPTKDGNGFISRLAADGRVDSLRFIESGRSGITLHAPRGMALVGDTLWVADIDAVRGFDRRTGDPLATVDLSPLGALLLNDIAHAPDGTLYVTDTGVQFDSAGNRQHTGPDRVFRIRAGQPSVALEGEWLGQPNGVTWDPIGKRLLLAPVAGDSTVQEWTEGAARPEPIARGPGRYDGVEVLPGGRILVAAWNDSTVSEVVGKELRPLIRGVPAPADIGVDPERGVVAIPILQGDRVELWALGH
jgi:sugar lactone lactonase YvrE